MMTSIFEYRSRILASNLLPGGHKSHQRGAGADFYRQNYFMADPDPARIDMNASFTDPFEQLYVRSYRQPSKLDVLLLIDGSSSMLFGNKRTVLLSMYRSIKASVEQRADPFTCCVLMDELVVIKDEQQLKETLNKNRPEDNKAKAFAELEKILPRRSSLIFMLSDFYWQKQQLESVFNLLSAHTVVPAIIQNAVEYDNFPLWRFVEVRDLETGKSQLIFATKQQKTWIQKSYQDFYKLLSQYCKTFNYTPFWVLDDYSSNQMNTYFTALY